METKEKAVIIFKRDENNLLPLAEEKEAVGDKEGALSLYLELLTLPKPSPKIFKRIANLYTSLGMYNNSIAYWFKYLNCVSKRHFSEAYNGLGGNYYLLGDNDLAAYYFNLQLNGCEDDEFAFDDYLYELFSGVAEKNQPFKIVDIQGDIDKEKIANAKKIFEDSRQEAFALLESIKEDSSEYENACITLGAFYMIEGDYAQAIKKYQLVTDGSEGYRFAVNNIFGAYYCLEDFSSAESALKVLKGKGLCDFNQLVKFFHLIKSKGNHQLNYKYSRCLLNLFSTPRIYFYCGVASYNVKKYDEARGYFLDYFKITSSNVAKHNANASFMRANGKNDLPLELSYHLILPEEKLATLESLASKYLLLSKKQMRKIAVELFEFAEDCFSTSNVELQIIACQIISFLQNQQAERYLKNKLIDPLVADSVKSVMLTALVEMGNDKLSGLVYGGVYSRVPFEKVEFTDSLEDLFLGAYAIAFGRMAPYDESELYKLRDSVYDIYYRLVSNGNLRKVSDVLALAAFITVNAGITIQLMPEELIVYIGSSVENVNKIIKLTMME